MTFVSFPIAHSPHPVNHLSYVSYLTLILPQDDTSGIASPPTYYATQPILRSPETFAFPHPTHQPTLGTKVPCIPAQHMHPRFYVSYVIPRPALARRPSDAGGRTAAKRMSTPRSLRSLRSRRIPTRQFHVKHERTDRPVHEDEIRHAPGLTRSARLRCAAPRRP